MDQVFDVAVIGGGINGCGCAADAALRGLSVALIEEDDIGSKTSSKSTKLIHGGLRYLEYLDFAMVKKSLNERQILLKLAPHLIRPLPLVLPLNHKIRPAWMIRAGLFLYDRLSQKNTLPKSKAIHRSTSSDYFAPLALGIEKGFLFYDCTTDDARLTLANALQAREHGTAVFTRTKLVNTTTNQCLWTLTLDTQNQTREIKARAIINAAGPWVEAVNNILHIENQYPMTLVKGSHFVVHKLYDGEHAYFFQHEDNRMIFVIPYHGHTMIGTTDVKIKEPLEKEINISSEEIDYLCNVVNQYLKKTTSAKDIVHSWSGMRPLLASTGKSLKELSRDYTFFYTQNPAPAVVLCGGKLTTYRQLASQAVDELKVVFPYLPPSKTMVVPLPGGEFPGMDFIEYTQYARGKYSWLGTNLLERLLQTYGTRLEVLLDGFTYVGELGKHFGQDLYQAEVDYLVREEWVQSAEDILWRRTKLGLIMSEQEQQNLRDYLKL
jgi:glycerol-3-phosphate dehydrogenase